MSDSIVIKDIEFQNATIKAIQDENQEVWIGVRWICEGIGISDDRMKYERKKIQLDPVMSKGVKFYPSDNGKQTLFIKLDFLPLWLARFTITPKMKKENPDLSGRLIDYQMEAKDVLAAALIGNENEVQILSDRLDQLNAKMDLFYKDMGKLVHLLTPHTDEQIVTYSPDLEREKWKKEIGGKISYLSKKLKKPKGVIFKQIYYYMNKNYGIVWEQDAKDKGSSAKIDIIYEVETYRSIFESVLNDMIGENFTPSLDEIIRPLILNLSDKSPYRCATWRKVYKKMGVNWGKMLSDYVMENGYKTVTKKALIMNDAELFNKFTSTVKVMLNKKGG